MDTRFELEAEVKVLRKALGDLAAEVAHQEARRSAVGNTWLRDWIESTRKRAQAAREAAAKDAGQVPASERQKRAFRSFL